MSGDGISTLRQLIQSAARALAVFAVLLPSSLAAQVTDLVFANGYEDPPPARLVVHYPAGASTMTARGSGGGLDWASGVPFVRSGDTFTLSLPLTAPVEWKPYLNDATAALGPNYRVSPGQTVEVHPHFTTTTGEVVTLIASFQSTLLGNTRAIYAYLPPTYRENSLARMPVVYMQDGQNLWAARPDLAFGGVAWQVDTAFDAAAGNGAFAEAIVIGIASTPGRLGEYTPTAVSGYPGSGNADLYLRMLIEELKPQIDAVLRTRPERASTVIGGSSLGGLLSAYAGRTKPDVFGHVAALSPASWWDGNVIVGLVQSTPAAPNRPLRVYVDSGDSGAASDNVTTTTMLAAAYRDVGYIDNVNFRHIVQAGATHSETFWAQRFPGAMAVVLGPGR